MVTIVPSLYTGKGLLSDDNQIFDNFAGGLLRGFTINPTPVAGQYFTPVGGGTPSVTGGMQDDEGMSEEDFARLMQEYRNQQNLLNEGDPADDREFAPPEADPGVYDGSLLDFISDPNGLLSMTNVPGFSPFGTLRGLIDTLRTGRSYQDLARGRNFAYDTSDDDLEDVMGLTGGDVNDPAAMGSDPSFDFDLGAPEEEDDGFGGVAI